MAQWNVMDDGALSLAGADLKELPQARCEEFGAQVKNLDLTNNSIRDFRNLKHFPQLTDLILDKNNLSELKGVPVMRNVTTLWLNNNNISDLALVMDQLSRCFPNLAYLSMMKNPAVPDIYFSDGEDAAYQRFRLYTIYRNKNLSFLDSTPVSPGERKQAMKYNDSGPTESKSSGARVLDAPMPKPAAFLARGKMRYDGTHSEGNRFISNDDL